MSLIKDNMAAIGITLALFVMAALINLEAVGSLFFLPPPAPGQTNLRPGQVRWLIHSPNHSFAPWLGSSSLQFHSGGLGDHAANHR